MLLKSFLLYALSGNTAVTSADWQAVIDSLTAQISVSTVVGVLAGVVGAGIGLVFMWWGIRKGISVLMAAFKKGRLKV